MLGTLFALASLAGGSIDPALARHLATLQPEEEVQLLVLMRERYDGARMQRQTAGLPRAERAERVRRTLTAHALRTQRDVARRLSSFRPRGAGAGDTGDTLLWIANARSVRCPAARVEELAREAGVARIAWDRPLALEDAPAPAPWTPLASGVASGAASGANSRATPNIVAHQATAVWDLGVDGSGVLLLNIDSGVALDHPALAPSLWQNPGEIPGNRVDDDGNGYVDDVVGWDFLQRDNLPYDGGHGTATAGILVGNGAGNGGTATGMAPGATMAVARVGTAGQLLEAYQYAVTIGADVVSSSHSVKWGDLPDYHAFRSAMEMELAAGIVHANSIGNRGLQITTDPVPWNIATPGNCPGPWVHPQQLRGGRASVLGVGAILPGSDALYAYGSRGPSAWEDMAGSVPSFPWPQLVRFWDYPYWNGAGPGLLKPDLVAYTNVVTTQGSSGYLPSFGGTSAATPHVGGALCLLLSENPSALPRQLSQALQETALDLEQPGKDVTTGAGKLRAYDAALRVRSLVTLLPEDPAPGESFDIVISGPEGTPYLIAIAARPGTHPTPFGFDMQLDRPQVLLSGVHTGVRTPTVLRVGLPSNAALSGMELYFQSLTDETRGASRSWLLSLLEKLTIR